MYIHMYMSQYRTQYKFDKATHLKFIVSEWTLSANWYRKVLVLHR